MVVLINPSLRFDPFFMEEAVFLIMRDNGEYENLVKTFHREREEIYQVDIPMEALDKNFQLFYARYFDKMGLRNTFKKIILEFPLLCTSKIEIFIKGVVNERQEDSELFVWDEHRTAYVGILARRILDPFFLETFLRHELLRISDMVDPDFEYFPQPDLEGKNEIENNLIRGRFGDLWDFYIDSRLRIKGYTTTKSQKEQRKELREKFFFIKPSEWESILLKIETGRNLRQADLLCWSYDLKRFDDLRRGRTTLSSV